MSSRHAIVALAVAVLCLPTPADADESARQDSPAPESVEGITDSMKPAPQPELAPLFPRLSMLMKELPPFLRDTHLRWNTRTFYLNNSGGEDPRREAWALGGSLTYRSGKLWDLLSVGATLFTSQKLIGKKSRDGTLLLRERQRSYTVVGESYARLERFGLQATFYRQELDLPYVNKRDGRMTPNTYEAYTLRGIYEGVFGLDRVQFIAGHITDMKERNSDRFKSMSEIAGVDGSSHGLTTAGFLIQPFEKFYLGTVNHYVKDTLNTSYSSADYTWSVTDELASLEDDARVRVRLFEVVSEQYVCS